MMQQTQGSRGCCRVRVREAAVLLFQLGPSQVVSQLCRAMHTHVIIMLLQCHFCRWWTHVQTTQFRQHAYDLHMCSWLAFSCVLFSILGFRCCCGVCHGAAMNCSMIASLHGPSSRACRL